MCNDREQAMRSKSELRYMCSVALPNCLSSSTVLAQENSIEYQNITKTPFLQLMNYFIYLTNRQILSIAQDLEYMII